MLLHFYYRIMTEERFSELLPKHLQKASRVYFTPVRIAIIATQWLTEEGQKKILDIGAGVGKFCIVGARYSNSHFHGVEYRPSLVEVANNLIKHFELENASMLQGNIVEVDFLKFDAFYLYNPFYENLLASRCLNNEVELAGPLYGYYFKYTEQQLERTKPGTRLVTFHGNNFEVPGSFSIVKEAEGGALKLWIKQI